MFETDMAEWDTAETLAATARAQSDEHEAGVQRLLLSVHYADLHPDPAMIQPDQSCPGGERGLHPGGPGCPGVAEFAVAEFAVVMGVSIETAAKHIGQALALRHRLPLTWDRVLAREAIPWRAREVATASMGLTVEAAAIVDRRVAPIINTVGPGQLRNIVKAAVWEADPETARAEAEAKARERGVYIGRSDDHGTSTVYVKADTGSVITFNATINQIADALTTLEGPAPYQTQRARAFSIISDPALSHLFLQVAQHLATHQPTPETTPPAEPAPDTNSTPATDPALAANPSPPTDPAPHDPATPDPSSTPDTTTNSSDAPTPIPDTPDAKDSTSTAADLPETSASHDNPTPAPHSAPNTPGTISTPDTAAHPADASPHTAANPAEASAELAQAPAPRTNPTPATTTGPGNTPPTANPSHTPKANAGEPLDHPYLPEEPDWLDEPDPPDPPRRRRVEPLDPAMAEALTTAMDTDARNNLAAKLFALKAAAHKTSVGCCRPTQTKLYVHLTDETLLAGQGTMRIEAFGPAYAKLAELIGYDRVVIQPVIDLNEGFNVNAYEIPTWMRERVKLTHPVEQFPYGPGETTTRTDLDHVIPYDPNGPEGQTSTANLRPLRRRSHRIKTHAGWTEHTNGNTTEWTTPHGYRFRVDHNGTHPIHNDHP
jgi:hypothetical protein